MRKLSVALAVYNEEANLARCLESAKAIADEIVIVDGGSTDKTIEIARAYTQHIIETTNPPIFHINKQKAVDACSEEWILQLDADEEVSKELRDEIFGVVRMSDSEREVYKIDNKKLKLFSRHKRLVDERDGRTEPVEGSIVAYYIPRRNFFLGKPMTYAGMYPDGVIRLFKRGQASFPAENVHEQLLVKGRIGFLQHDLLHYSNPTLSRYISGANKYTSLLAEDMKKENKNIVVLFFQFCIIKPKHTFWSLFLRHKGILDGVHGYLFSLFSALHYPVAFWKYVKMDTSV